MLLSQAGLMAYFSPWMRCCFYFFWELALIPVYFLCSLWGGEKRIQATFKFFIYTFVGSLLMLGGYHLSLPAYTRTLVLDQVILCAAGDDPNLRSNMVVLAFLYCIRYQDADLSISYMAARYL